MKRPLRASYWLGLVADGIVTILLFSPMRHEFVLQPQTFEKSAVDLHVSRVAAALMPGWTVPLCRAQRRPVEPAAILPLTLFPVVTVMAIAGAWVVESGQIAFASVAPRLVSYAVPFAMEVPSYLWANQQARR